MSDVRARTQALAKILKLSAEAKIGDFGHLGALVDQAESNEIQKLTFYGADGRILAPLPGDGEPHIHAQIVEVVSNKLDREYVKTTGQDSFYISQTPFYLPDRRVAGVVEIRVNLDHAIETQRINTQVATTGAVILLLISFFVAFYAQLSLGKPIRRLLAGMDAVIDGDLTSTIPLDHNDEIGSIAYRFNEMTAQLRAAQIALQANAEAKLKLEGSLRRTEKLATIGQLSAEIAHEVGTPLNVIGGRARSLKKKAEQPEEVIKNAEIIASQVTRITKIIQQVLDIAHTPTTKRTKVYPKAIIEETLTFLEYEIRNSSIEVHSTFNTEKPFDAEKDSIQQVVLNLLLNAIQAMPSGGKLTILIEEVHRRKGGLDLSPPQPFLMIVVIDEGVGIPVEDRTKVFDPFYSTKEKEEGTGLGLTVVHGIVKEHDGWIEIDTPNEKGTRFSVYFPLEDSENLENKHSTDESITNDDSN